MKVGPVYATNGSVVPVTPDFRKLYSQPTALALLGRLIGDEAKRQRVRILAGLETCGIPLAAAASLASRLPMVYLRKKPHAGWSKSIVDGAYRRGARTALVDDAITFGGQKGEFIRKLRGELKPVAILTIWDSSYSSRYRKVLPTKDLAVRSLVTKLEVMAYMLQHKLMQSDTYEVMLAQTKNPLHWHEDAKFWRLMGKVKRRGTL